MTAIILRIVKFIINVIYFFIKLLPTKNKVVMISRQSNDINTDFRLIGSYIGKKYQVVYLCKTLDGGVKSKFTSRIKYGLHMFSQMYHLATSKVCILDTYCPTVSILKHKESLTIIQIWHSIGTMKKFGYAIIDKGEGTNGKIANIMNMHQNYDVILCSGEGYRTHLTWGFNCSPDLIRIATLPRVDLLTDKKYEREVKMRIITKYPSLKKRKNILYCPTFRKDEKEFADALENLIKEINFKKYNLIVKLHPLSNTVLDTHEHVINDREFPTFDMLFIADYVISDYSCIIYEAGVRDIPLYFYNFDMNTYEDKRGLALDYDELPGYTSPDAKTLMKFLEKEYDMQYYREFMKKYVENTKDCTKKVVEIIDEYMK